MSTATLLDSTYGLPIDPSTRKIVVAFIEVINSNPNGDPDCEGAPRQDLNEHGIISSWSIKRLMRDYAHDVLNKKLFYQRGIDLGELQTSYDDNDAAMLADLWGARVFGATMTHVKGKDRVVRRSGRGPFQFGQAVSLDAVRVMELGLVRTSGTFKERKVDINSAEGTTERILAANMGRMKVVSYGLYHLPIFYSPMGGARHGVTADDLAAVWESLIEPWQDNRAANRPQVNLRRLYVFDYPTARGNVHGHVVASRVQVTRRTSEPTCFEDYQIEVNLGGLPEGLTLHQWVDDPNLEQAAAK